MPDLRPPAAMPPGPAPLHRRARRFGVHLLRLMLAVTLPLVMLATGLVGWTAEERRHEALRDIEATAQSLQVTLDRQFRQALTLLEVLGTSPALDQALAEAPGGPGIAAFHAQARSLVAGPGGFAVVALLPAGDDQQVMNTRIPVGERPPALGAARFPPRPVGPTPQPGQPLLQAIAAGQSFVSDLLLGPVAGHVMVLGVPIHRDGTLVGGLVAALEPRMIAALLDAELRPDQGRAMLVDRGGVIIAVSGRNLHATGQPAPPEMQAFLRDPARRAALVTAAGQAGPLYAAMRRLEAVPFAVGFAAPQAQLDQPLRRALLLAGLGGAAALALAAGAALWLGRRLGAEVAALGADALPLARGEAPPARAPSRIAEIAAARGALAGMAQDLAASEARFARAVAAARMAAWEWEVATDRVTGSAGREALYGMPAGSLASTRALFARLHPDDRERVRRAARAALAGARGGLYDEEYRILWPDGSLRWLMSKGRAEFDATGRAVRMHGVVVDVTDRRRAEEALRESEGRLLLAQDAAGIGAWERDLGTGAAIWSEQQYRLFGLPPDGPPPGPAALRAMVVADDGAPGLITDQIPPLAPIAPEGDAPLRGEYRIRRADTGEIRWIQALGRPLRGPDGRPVRIVGVSLDITDRRAAEERQALLMREVDHRAKNALAVALSIVQLAPRDVPAEAFAAGVTARIAAMARTHSLLASEGWAGADLATLVEAELAAYAGHVETEGRPLRISAGAAQPVAMLLHELATNAAKHGALSAPDGRVALAWSREAEALRIVWRERGGPRLAGPPARTGFGSRLLVSLAERQLGGSVALDWSDPEGLTATLVLPARHLA
jgi:PAS domain S-box-containing protein